jgi:hypothetical protein
VQKCTNRNADHYGLLRLKRRKIPEERREQWSQSLSRTITTIKFFTCERVRIKKYENVQLRVGTNAMLFPRNDKNHGSDIPQN